MTSLTPLRLFKNLSDETRLTLVLLLRHAGELCVCELSGALALPQPKSQGIWRCCVKTGCCSIGAMASGYIIACRRICRPGRRGLLSRLISVGQNR